MWHVSSRSDVATLRTVIHLLLTYLLTYFNCCVGYSDMTKPLSTTPTSPIFLISLRSACSLYSKVLSKCAENYLKMTIHVFFKTAIGTLLISNHNSFRVLFDKLAFVCFICETYYYLSVGNGQSRELALCQLYRRTFDPCWLSSRVPSERNTRSATAASCEQITRIDGRRRTN